MSEHAVIWLEPSCDKCCGEDRLWCQDNVWEDGCEECGAPAIKYALCKSDQLIGDDRG